RSCARGYYLNSRPTRKSDLRGKHVTQRSLLLSKRLVSQAHRPTSGTESPRHIFRASTSEISVCLGTASTAPVVGLVHNECDRPSRFKWHPCLRRWRSRSPRFTRRRPSPASPWPGHHAYHPCVDHQESV